MEYDIQVILLSIKSFLTITTDEIGCWLCLNT